MVILFLFVVKNARLLKPIALLYSTLILLQKNSRLYTSLCLPSFSLRLQLLLLILQQHNKEFYRTCTFHLFSSLIFLWVNIKHEKQLLILYFSCILLFWLSIQFLSFYTLLFVPWTRRTTNIINATTNKIWIASPINCPKAKKPTPQPRSRRITKIQNISLIGFDFTGYT